MVSHIELWWETPGHRSLMQRLGVLGRVVAFDKRGTGLSDRTRGAGAIEDRLLDLGAVMDAAGMARAHLVAVSDGAPVAMVFAAQQPERVQSIVSLGGFAAGHQRDPEVGLTPDEIERNVQAVVDAWGTGTMCPRLIRGIPVDAARRLEMYANSPAGQGDVMRSNNDMDVTPILGAIEAPTLLVHCVGDPGVRVGWAHQLADGIADAVVVEIDADFHWSYLAEDMDLYGEAIEEFWVGLGDGMRASAPSTRTLATVLFSDIVDSTRLVRFSRMSRSTVTPLAEHVGGWSQGRAHGQRGVVLK